MSPVLYYSRIALRGEDTAPQPPASASDTVNPPLVVYVQDDTASPPATVSTSSATPPPTVSPPVEASPAMAPSKPGLSQGTKIGLAMIPVVVFLCLVWVLALYWWRKRRAQKIMRDLPPPVPEKDDWYSAGSIASSRRGSRVSPMPPMSPPIRHGRYREASVIGRSSLREQYDPTKDSEMRATTSEGKDDSPIDSKSPFRLKTGNSVKRLSLGTHISKLWPSPPPSAWTRQPRPTISRPILHENLPYKMQPDRSPR
jgi:hypothetical protein